MRPDPAAFEPWRLLLPAVLAALTAWAVDWASARKGFLPPGFRQPWRRTLAFAALAALLYLGVFAPLGLIGLEIGEMDLSGVSAPRLFLLHLLMLASLLVWFLAGFVGAAWPPAHPPDPLPGEDLELREPPPPTPRPSLGRVLASQLGFVTPDVGREVGLGLALGVVAWGAVLAAVIAIGLTLYALGADELVPKQPPALIPFIAGLPVGVRLLVSLSAGVVEETFFRGFLQPRIGIALSTALFVLAHASYGQPFMLVGITLLSVIYALIVRWRQNLWPAIAAHTLFDAVQLLVVVPAVLRMMGK